MPARINLNMDVLRTFVTGLELGSFSRAAERLGRSQSAISTQLRRLEEQVGKPLLKKSGRGLALTTAGESLFSYAKRILELNDEVVDRRTGRSTDLLALGIYQPKPCGTLGSDRSGLRRNASHDHRVAARPDGFEARNFGASCFADSAACPLQNEGGPGSRVKPPLRDPARIHR